MLLVLLLLSACTKSTETGTNAPVTIRVAPDWLDATDPIIAAFHDQYPMYRVEKVQLDTSYTDFSAGAMATLIREKKIDLVVAWPELVQDDLLLPLDAYMNSAKFDPEPYLGLLEPLRTGGHLYELPFTLKAHVLVYNRDLFKARGVAPPAPGWTWDDFREKAAALTEGEGGEKIWGFATQSPADLVIRMLEQRSDEPPARADEATLREVVSLAYPLVHTDRSVAPAFDVDYSADNVVLPPEPNYFKQGKAAMSLSWRTATLHKDRRNKAPWETAALPTWPGKPAVLPVTTQGYGIAATTEVPEAAWAFLQFLTGEPGAVILAKQGGVPAYASKAVQQAWSEQKPPQPASTAIFFTLPRRLISGDESSFYWRANSMLAGQKTAEQMLQEYLNERDKRP